MSIISKKGFNTTKAVKGKPKNRLGGRKKKSKSIITR